MTSGSLLGTLMLGSLEQEPPWSAELEQPLQMPGAVFAASLARKQAEEALIERDRLSRGMLAPVRKAHNRRDNGGRVVAVSEGRAL